MSGAPPPLILASASPRRREILSSLGVAIEVQPSRADEEALQIEDDVEFVRAAARMKLEDVLGACQHAVDAHDGVRSKNVRAGVLAGAQDILQLHPGGRANELHVIFDLKGLFVGATWLHLDCDPE